jgi:hypothetical protein
MRRLDESRLGFLPTGCDEKGGSGALQQMRQPNPRWPSIEQIESTVNHLDRGVRLPVLPLRLPLDPIIGLVPFAGDVLTLIISGSIIGHARRLGVPKSAQRKMAINALTDCVLGCVPLVGDIFDFFYKANQKNLVILKQHVTSPSHNNPRKGGRLG